MSERQKIQGKFIPYDLASKLAELGFDEECAGYYRDTVLVQYNSKTIESEFNSNSSRYVRAPTYQEAFDWIREEYGLHPVISPTITASWEYHITRVICKLDYPYISGEKPLDDRPLQNGTVYSKYEYSQHEEARLECLKEMISIIKKGCETPNN